MNIVLSAELEILVERQIQRGLYPNATEAVAAAVRKAFCEPEDIEQDTPELAELLRQALNSRHTPYKRGDLRRAVEGIRQQSLR
jgi:Arc/MetJ-type ribon-helix-helix transcriptional regulator